MYFKLLLATMLLVGVLTGGYIIREKAQEVGDLGEQLPTEEIEAEEIHWVTNIAEGLRLAREANKPLLVYFHADWCVWCRRMVRDTLSAGEVIGLSRNFISVKVDTVKYPQVSREYRVTGLPTIIFLAPEGEAIKRVVGFRNSTDLAGLMEEVMEGL